MSYAWGCARTTARLLLLLSCLWPALARAQAPQGLSAEQVARLKKVIHDKGTSVPIPVAVANAVHLASSQVAPVVQQVTWQGDDGARHIFALLNDGSGYLLIHRSGDGGTSVFRVDRNFQRLFAARNFEKERYIEMADPDAQAELDEEIGAWSGVLSPRRLKMAPPATAPAPPPTPPAPK